MRLLWLLPAAAFAMAAVVAALGEAPAARGLAPVMIAFDFEPGAAPANGATSLGSIEGCTSVANTPGTTFSFDVIVDQIPAGETFSGFNYLLEFDDTRFKIVGQDHEMALSAKPGRLATALSEQIPDIESPHNVAETDLNTTTGAEEGPLAGVLGRYIMEVLAGASAGVAVLSLSSPGDDFVFNATGDPIRPIKLTVGFVALGQPCPSPLPSPTPPPGAEELYGATPPAGGDTGGQETPDAGQTPSPQDQTPGAGAEGTPGAGTPGAVATGTPGQPTPTSTPAAGGSGDDGGDSAWPYVAGGIAAGAAAAAAGGGLWWRRRQRLGRRL